jgi:phage terminase large subunit
MPKLFMTCNPEKGWVYNSFYDKWKKGTLEDYKVFIPSLATDNPHIDPSYIKSLKT